MRKLSVLLLLLACFVLVQTAEARQPQNLSVKIGTEKTTPRGGIKIKFEELIEDSRCPTDSTCIWAGSAKIKIKVSKNGNHSETFEINTGIEPNTVEFKGYEIKFVGLTPRPASNIRIRRDGYVAAFSITKARP